ncbi:MAG TPA: HAD-IA family hydrolase [Clostridiales bacterium]|nr:HAD-IA family hydrolase [Clostridiales bacterium]
MKYNTVIFDLDGTLLNTLDDLRDSLNEVLMQHSYLPQRLEDVRRFVGNGVWNLVRRSLPDSCPDQEVTRIMEEFKAHYKKNMQNKTRPYNGIMELLLDLNRFNYKLAIVSNKYDAAVKELAQTYFGNLIPVAIGETSEIRRKPAPDSIYTAIQELGSTLDSAILVGDSETDVQTAKNAGIPCIGVTWGFRRREVLREEGADFLIDTPRELLTLI